MIQAANTFLTLEITFIYLKLWHPSVWWIYVPGSGANGASTGAIYTEGSISTLVLTFKVVPGGLSDKWTGSSWPVSSGPVGTVTGYEWCVHCSVTWTTVLLVTLGSFISESSEVTSRSILNSVQCVVGLTNVLVQLKLWIIFHLLTCNNSPTLMHNLVLTLITKLKTTSETWLQLKDTKRQKKTRFIQPKIEILIKSSPQLFGKESDLVGFTYSIVLNKNIQMASLAFPSISINSVFLPCTHKCHGSSSAARH